MSNKKSDEFYFKMYRPIASDKNLSAIEKLVAAYIYTFQSFKRPCTASNKHIAELLRVSESSVSTAITSLVKHGYILKDKNHKDGKGYTVLRPEITLECFYKFNPVMFDYDITPSARLVMMYVLSYLRKNKRFYASNKNMTNDLGLKTTAITDSIRQLKTKRIFKVINPKSRKRELKFI